MMKTVFVLSDFGCRDSYCGQMKASLLTHLGGEASIIDLGNCISAGDIASGAFQLMISMPHIPPGTGLLAIVDPGVGTERRALIALSGGVLVAAPDNGLLSWIELERVFVLPPSREGSTVFHGRDLFAPALARAMTDGAWLETLEEIAPASIVRRPKNSPRRTVNGIETEVAHVDGFGNCILWLTRTDAEGFVPREVLNTRGSSFTIKRADTYGPAGPGLILLEGSSRLLEIALSGGSAAYLTGLSEGDTVLLRS